MDFKRILKHLMTTERHVRKIFTRTHLEHIAHSIQASETQHSGEIRFAVESALELQALLDRETPRQRAIEVFSELHVWDTELNNGVLIYVLLADHAIEIVADRGIHAKVDSRYWEELCQAIEAAFAQGHYEEGVKACIAAVNNKLIEHFPHDGGGKNELPDTPVIIA
ncbi:TPM domain-containing protein [Limnobacter sp.]|uniref:TPM domain-containing protein n=1 Tax=Limnobacter sp. TaxID=2003368 RepID=UPI002FDF0DDD